MVGLISLHRQIYCKSDVLGKAFPTNIAGVNVTIHFPRTPNHEPEKKKEKSTTIPLASPAVGGGVQINNQPVKWGYVSDKRWDSASISYLSCSVDCPEEDEEKVAKVILESTVTWAADFVDYCELAGKQISQVAKNQWTVEPTFFLSGTSGVMMREPECHLEIKFAKESQYLTVEQISKAIEFASSDKGLKLAYQLLLSAADSKRNRKNRHAIFDACSAVELCLNDVIKAFAEGRGIKAEELPSHRLLGDKFKLVKLIDQDFPEIDAMEGLPLNENDVSVITAILEGKMTLQDYFSTLTATVQEA